jgi:hypothetical protein
MDINMLLLIINVKLVWEIQGMQKSIKNIVVFSFHLNTAPFP